MVGFLPGMFRKIHVLLRYPNASVAIDGFLLAGPSIRKLAIPPLPPHLVAFVHALGEFLDNFQFLGIPPFVPPILQATLPHDLLNC